VSQSASYRRRGRPQRDSELAKRRNEWNEEWTKEGFQRDRRSEDGAWGVNPLRPREDRRDVTCGANSKQVARDIRSVGRRGLLTGTKGPGRVVVVTLAVSASGD
jgi:hypothetical protein